MGLFSQRREQPEEPDKKEGKKVEWMDPDESVKYVCAGAKVQCKYCDQPISDLVVTTESVQLQDQPWATVGDKDGKKNLPFKGHCMHPSQQKPFCSPPPCQAVIKLDKWRDYSETLIGTHKALLVKSKIKCMVSGEDLGIVHSGQMATLSAINPFSEFLSTPFSLTDLMDSTGTEAGKRKILDAYWIHKTPYKKMYKVKEFHEVDLRIKSTGYKEGETVTLRLECEHGRCFETGSKEMTVSGIVDGHGMAIVKGLKINYQ